MIGVNLNIHRFGIVAIFATLFLAICVNGEKGYVFNFENFGDFDLECNDVKNAWKVNADDGNVLALAPEEDGCLRTKDSVLLNSTSRVIFRFYRDSASDKNEKLILSLKPTEGNCPDEECVWNVARDPQSKAGNWVTAEYKFPLKSMREFRIQLEVEKSKGKFLLDHITIPNPAGDLPNMLGGIRLPSQLVAVEGNSTPAPSGAPTVTCWGMTKNLMITTASVITVKNLIN